MNEPIFTVIPLTKQLLPLEMGVFMSEHMTHQMGVIPPEEGSEEVYINFQGKHTARNGVLALPVGDVLILRLSFQGVTSPAVYMVTSKDKVESVEQAVIGLTKDFSIIHLVTELTYIDEKSDVCANVYNKISSSSNRLVAVWFDIKDYMQELQQSMNMVVQPIQS